MVRAYLHVCETMFTQARLGAGDFGIVMAEESGIKAVFASAVKRMVGGKSIRIFPRI